MTLSLIDAHHLGLGQTGNETWARNVIRELGSRPHQPHVAVTRAGRDWLGAWPVERVHVVSASSTRRLVVDLPRVTRRVHPDALLVQYTLPSMSAGVQGVVVIHDLSFERPEAREWIPAPTLARYRATIRRSARRAAAVLVPTEWTRRDVLQRYRLAEDRVVVAGNAVDTELAAKLATASRQVREGLTVLAVGTVLPRKNLQVAALAVAALRAEGLEVRLRLVGPVPAAGADVLRDLHRVLGDGLDLVGPVTVDQLAREYVSADVLAFPSLFEGFGIPLIEAMAAGLPVVSSDSSCLPEVGGDAVLYADPQRIDAWVESLRQVLFDAKIRGRLVTGGREQASTFSWGHTADQVQATLTAVAA